MSDNPNSKCPYCGSSMLEEEDGYRCRFCKSFFPFEAEQVKEKEEPYKLSLLRPQIVESPERGWDKARVDAEKAFQKERGRNELIGLATAVVSTVCMILCKLLQMPLLMIPGFIFFAFSGAFAGYSAYKANKAGRRVIYIRVFAMLVVAILCLLFVKPKQ